MNARFESRRADGRSHQEVLIAHVANATPETVFLYDELLGLLNEDIERPFDRRGICAVVRRANPQLLKSYQRELRNIPSEGFRMASASEQLVLADHRRTKANRQLSRGLLSVENARTDELKPNERALRDAMSVGFRTVFHLIRGLHARQAKQDEVIATILKRQDRHDAQIAELKEVK